MTLTRIEYTCGCVYIGAPYPLGGNRISMCENRSTCRSMGNLNAAQATATVLLALGVMRVREA